MFSLLKGKPSAPVSSSGGGRRVRRRKSTKEKEGVEDDDGERRRRSSQSEQDRGLNEEEEEVDDDDDGQDKLLDNTSGKVRNKKDRELTAEQRRRGRSSSLDRYRSSKTYEPDSIKLPQRVQTDPFPARSDSFNKAGPSQRIPHMSDHVPDQFPGQFPSDTALPYRPPLSIHEGGPGLASDYYGDAGESVQTQPGVRPLPPLVNSQPHLMTAGQNGGPPPEPSSTGEIGAAAAFYDTSLPFGPTTTQAGAQGRPTGSNTPTRPPVRPNAVFASLPAIGTVAAGVAAAYFATSHHDNAISSSAQQGQSHGNNSSGHQPNLSLGHSNGEPQHSVSASSNLPPYATAAAGIAGLAADTYMHQSTSSNPSAMPETPASQTVQYHTHAGQRYPIYSSVQRRRPTGTLGKVIDWFKDPDGVSLYEEYTEYIGVCRYCFPSDSSPMDAPRRHGVGLRSRRSMERLDPLRIDKERRYKSSSSSDSEEQQYLPRKNGKRSMLAAGIATAGLTAAASKILARSKDLDDSEVAKRYRSSRTREQIQRRSESDTERVAISRTSTTVQDEKASKNRGRWVRKKKSRLRSRSRSISRSKSRSRSPTISRAHGDALVGAMAGIAAGAVLASATTRKASPPPLPPPPQRAAWVRKRSRRTKSGSESPDRRISHKSSPANDGFFSGFFSPPSQDYDRESQRGIVLSQPNRSSSSVDSDLIVGDYDWTPKQESKHSTRPLKSAKEAREALLGLGAATVALKTAQSVRGPSDPRRAAELLGKPHPYARDPSRRQQDDNEDGWVDESEAESVSTVDSALAFGSSLPKRRSYENLSDSGTEKWFWRWRSNKDKKQSGKSQIAESVGAGLIAGALGAELLSEQEKTRKRERDHETAIDDRTRDRTQAVISERMPFHQPQPQSTVLPEFLESQSNPVPQPAALPQSAISTAMSKLSRRQSLKDESMSVRFNLPQSPEREAKNAKSSIGGGPLPLVVTAEVAAGLIAEETLHPDDEHKRSAIEFDEDAAAEAERKVRKEARRAERREQKRLEKIQQEERSSINMESLPSTLDDTEAYKSREDAEDPEEREDGAPESKEDRRERRRRKREERERRDRENELGRSYPEYNTLEAEEDAKVDRRERTHQQRGQPIRDEDPKWPGDEDDREETKEERRERRRRRREEKESLKQNDERADTENSVFANSVTLGLGAAAITGALAEGSKRESSETVDAEKLRQDQRVSFQDNKDQVAEDMSKEQHRNARGAAERVPRIRSPGHESYADYFIPTELISAEPEEKEKLRDPIANSQVTFHGLFKNFTEPTFSIADQDEPVDESFLSRVPWRVPRLILRLPTPLSSPGSTPQIKGTEADSLAEAIELGESSPSPPRTSREEVQYQSQIEGTVESEDSPANVGDFAESTEAKIRPKAGSPSVEDHTDPYKAAETAQSRRRRRSPPQMYLEDEKDISTSPSMPGAFGEDVDFAATVAAGLENTGFDPDLVLKNYAFRRRDSPPRVDDTENTRRPDPDSSSPLPDRQPLPPAEQGLSRRDSKKAKRRSKIEPSPVDLGLFEENDSQGSGDKSQRIVETALAAAEAGEISGVDKGEEMDIKPSVNDEMDRDDLDVDDDNVDAATSSSRRRKKKKKRSPADEEPSNNVVEGPKAIEAPVLDEKKKPGRFFGLVKGLIGNSAGGAPNLESPQQDQQTSTNQRDVAKDSEYSPKEVETPEGISTSSHRPRVDDEINTDSLVAAAQDTKKVRRDAKSPSDVNKIVLDDSRHSDRQKSIDSGRQLQIGHQEDERSGDKPSTTSEKQPDAGKLPLEADETEWYEAKPSRSKTSHKIDKTSTDIVNEDDWDDGKSSKSRKKKKKNRKTMEEFDDAGLDTAEIKADQQPESNQATDLPANLELREEPAKILTEQFQIPQMEYNEAAHDVHVETTPPMESSADFATHVKHNRKRSSVITIPRGPILDASGTGSPTAIPLQFRYPASPRGSGRSTTSTPLGSPGIGRTPKSKPDRMPSVDMHSRDFRPLWLVERHGRSKPEDEQEPQLPPLPSSHETSQAPSTHSDADLTQDRLDGFSIEPEHEDEGPTDFNHNSEEIAVPVQRTLADIASNYQEVTSKPRNFGVYVEASSRNQHLEHQQALVNESMHELYAQELAWREKPTHSRHPSHQLASLEGNPKNSEQPGQSILESQLSSHDDIEILTSGHGSKELASEDRSTGLRDSTTEIRTEAELTKDRAISQSIGKGIEISTEANPESPKYAQSLLEDADQASRDKQKSWDDDTEATSAKKDKKGKKAKRQSARTPSPSLGANESTTMESRNPGKEFLADAPDENMNTIPQLGNLDQDPMSYHESQPITSTKAKRKDKKAKKGKKIEWSEVAQDVEPDLRGTIPDQESEKNGPENKVPEPASMEIESPNARSSIGLRQPDLHKKRDDPRGSLDMSKDVLALAAAAPAIEIPRKSMVDENAHLSQHLSESGDHQREAGANLVVGNHDDQVQNQTTLPAERILQSSRFGHEETGASIPESIVSDIEKSNRENDVFRSAVNEEPGPPAYTVTNSKKEKKVKKGKRQEVMSQEKDASGEPLEQSTLEVSAFHDSGLISIPSQENDPEDLFPLTKGKKKKDKKSDKVAGALSMSTNPTTAVQSFVSRDSNSNKNSEVTREHPVGLGEAPVEPDDDGEIQNSKSPRAVIDERIESSPSKKSKKDRKSKKSMAVELVDSGGQDLISKSSATAEMFDRDASRLEADDANQDGKSDVKQSPGLGVGFQPEANSSDQQGPSQVHTIHEVGNPEATRTTAQANMSAKALVTVASNAETTGAGDTHTQGLDLRESSTNLMHPMSDDIVDDNNVKSPEAQISRFERFSKDRIRGDALDDDLGLPGETNKVMLLDNSLQETGDEGVSLNRENPATPGDTSAITSNEVDDNKEVSDLLHPGSSHNNGPESIQAYDGPQKEASRSAASTIVESAPAAEALAAGKKSKKDKRRSKNLLFEPSEPEMRVFEQLNPPDANEGSKTSEINEATKSKFLIQSTPGGRHGHEDQVLASRNEKHGQNNRESDEPTDIPLQQTKQSKATDPALESMPVFASSKKSKKERKKKRGLGYIDDDDMRYTPRPTSPDHGAAIAAAAALASLELASSEIKGIREDSSAGKSYRGVPSDEIAGISGKKEEGEDGRHGSIVAGRSLTPVNEDSDGQQRLKSLEGYSNLIEARGASDHENETKPSRRRNATRRYLSPDSRNTSPIRHSVHISTDHNMHRSVGEELEPQLPPAESRFENLIESQSSRPKSDIESTSRNRASAALFSSSPSTRQSYSPKRNLRSFASHNDLLTEPTHIHRLHDDNRPRGDDRDLVGEESAASVKERRSFDHHRVRSPLSTSARSLGHIKRNDNVPGIHNIPGKMSDSYGNRHVESEKHHSLTAHDVQEKTGNTQPLGFKTLHSGHEALAAAALQSSISAIIHDPATARGDSPGILRHETRSISSDLRSAGNSGLKSDVYPTSPDVTQDTGFASSSRYNPLTDKGKRGPDIIKMTDVFSGWGEAPGSPRSPTRPASLRKRQSMHLLDLETRLESLAAENRSLVEQNHRHERNLETATGTHVESQRALQEAIDMRNEYLKQKDAELEQMRAVLQNMQAEILRLNETNRDMEAARSMENSQSMQQRCNELEAETVRSRQAFEESRRELEDVRSQHQELSTGMAAMINQEVRASMHAKDIEISKLQQDLDAARDQIRDLQQQIVAMQSSDDILIVYDEDHFEQRCQQLCQAVQQWVLRFSKFSDNKACRAMHEVHNESITDRFDVTMLDGHDVDNALASRTGRRDVFMSVITSMIWDHVFARYLFGMDREQRQKLKSLEKQLSDVGPMHAVHRWRAVTLTLLAKREGFETQRNMDTRAIMQEIFMTVAAFLTPPAHLVVQLQETLEKVISLAVDISIEMRTQIVEYLVLPPLKPAYNTQGILEQYVYFNATTMNERSGTALSNEQLQTQDAVVRMVLFPLVVRREAGIEDQEIICPAQVLIARDEDETTTRGISSEPTGAAPFQSVHSFAASTLDSNMI